MSDTHVFVYQAAPILRGGLINFKAKVGTDFKNTKNNKIM